MNDVYVYSSGEKQPPLGIMPEYIWKQKRVIDLLEAALRYLNSDFSQSEFLLITTWLDQAAKLCHELDGQGDK